ncbi:hypothetical protein SEA_ENCELADUS_97 [Mycobacterium phage Enceladus]|uniref:Uncharacterized protein n=1 Tax=Mycobacterium phage DirkDirk TaxID=2664225 RepID=A0A5Q2WFC3_9CAUD|nr:hypothetical protein KNU85_gp097 [Mycobacterium phage DirkDirk]QGH75207.1 hypothetical protein SEA_DIRKDIRK_97 [Mycobacterium phage DirkDirk]UEM46383.1 hypothetical protein SEA_ENCELADUS_97 [Mycobacterium phage Enceladus]
MSINPFYGPLPSIEDVNRAIEFVGWAYEGGNDVAVEMYRERYGDAPNFAFDSPDMGLLLSLTYLKRALCLIGEGKRIRYPVGGDGNPIISPLVEDPSGVQS